MPLLDDTRRLLEPQLEQEGVYVYCGGLVSEGHRLPCNLAAVPQIVAVIEASERLVAAWQLPPTSRPIPGSMGGFDVDFERGKVRHREIQQAEQDLTAALKGDQN